MFSAKSLLLIAAIATGSLIACEGCRSFSSIRSIGKLALAESEPTASPLHVKVDGQGNLLDDDQVAQTKVQDLLPAVNDLLRAQRARSARAYIHVRPDIALEVLRTHLTSTNNRPALKAIALVYDEQMALERERGWGQLYEGDAAESEKLQTYALARTRMQHALRDGAAITEVAGELAGAAGATGSPLLTIDQMYLTGIGHLLNDNPQAATATFNDACQLAAQVDKYQEVQLALLLSDAQRRCGNNPLANQIWLNAVSTAGTLARRQVPVVDPVFWDRASYLRPIGIDWPADVVHALARRAELPVQPMSSTYDKGDAEAIVWSAIGRGLQQRADHQAALIAFKRAEAAATGPTVRAWLRLAQAESLVGLDQFPAATAILVSLTSSGDACLVKAATASLGGLRLRQGDINTGYRLLAKALEAADACDWPGRTAAEADLGLVYLIRNEEAKGLEWLHSAQSRFQGKANLTGLSQSLWNEAAYWKQKGQTANEQRLLERLAAVESDPVANLAH